MFPAPQATLRAAMRSVRRASDSTRTSGQLTGGVSQSGNYRAEPRALNSGFTQWQLVWFVMSTGLQVGAAVNLSGETVRLAAIGQ